MVHLTHQAARDLRDIHRRSTKNWGESRAHRYLADIYRMFARIAERPDIGQARSRHASPFLMFPIGRHFVVYDVVGGHVVILAVPHRVRDIEGSIASMGPTFRSEIEAPRGRAAE